MHPASLILFCNQPNLRGDPNNSWVFDDIGGSTYLQIVLNRWRKFGNINKIYLVADSAQIANRLKDYQDGDIHVKLMSHNSHKPFGLTKGRIYNFGHRNEECIASWTYQIMKSEKEQMVFQDSILRGHVNFFELNNLRKKLVEEPGHCYTIVGDLGYEGVLLDFAFAESCVSNPNYDGIKFDHPDYLNHGHLYNYNNYTENRSLNISPTFDWNLETRQRWQFFKEFYTSSTTKDDKDIFIQFVEYFKLNSCKLSAMDLLHVELECVDQLGEMEMSTVDQLIANCLPFGRLTVVLRNLDKHTNGNEIARKLHSAGLHIYASISGHRSPDFYEEIYNHCDVINFELFAHTPELHAKRFPKDNANLIFQNYLTALLSSQKYQRMAVGVSYTIPADANEACQAILFFRERQSINPFFDSSGTRPGVQKPHIEFLRLIPASSSEYEFRPDTSVKTLRINSGGQYAKGESCFDKSFEKYLQDYGFDGEGI